MLNRLMQCAYWVAYRACWVLWFVVRPSIKGVFVVVWHDGRFLAIKNSYKKQWSVPGGMVDRDEAWEDAAIRETLEEVGVTIRREQLRFCADVRGRYNPNDCGKVYDVELDESPKITIDNREVVQAEFLTPEQAMARPLNPHIRDYLKQRGQQSPLAGTEH